MGLYKDEDLIVIKKRLRVGNHVEFQLTDELLFGVVDFPLRPGEVFDTRSVSSDLVAVNLNNFPMGVVVTLTQKPGGGSYVFTTEEAELY